MPKEQDGGLTIEMAMSTTKMMDQERQGVVSGAGKTVLEILSVHIVFFWNVDRTIL